MAELAAGALVLGLAGSAVSAYSGVQAAKAQAQAAEMEARSVENKSKFLETQQRRENKLIQGEANAITAASGVQLGSGSPLFMELDRIKQGELEALSIRQGGQVAAMGSRFGGEMAKRRIPSIIGDSVGQGGSILSTFIRARN